MVYQVVWKNPYRYENPDRGHMFRGRYVSEKGYRVGAIRFISTESEQAARDLLVLLKNDCKVEAWMRERD